ncbi:hypothetical protein [Ferrimonas gelatinilytica]|uniref:Uncharacterized protein n=1 Tax=Ferrimonas gelatinilytica TaxID=1255257 RepID=A0ABP9SBC4_9GAMM
MNPERKIFKAIYLLLEKYHRLYGLEVYLFSGGHGAGYAGFQVAANRCWDTHHNDLNYGAISGRPLPLVAYLPHVGIPSWAAGRQLEMVGWETARTLAILDWHERNLALASLFRDNAAAIARWRADYSVEQSEQYLLMINLAGLLAAKASDFPRLPSQCLSEYDPTAVDQVRTQLARLGLESEHHGVMGIPGCMVTRHGKALVGEEVVDVWQRRLNGDTPQQIADALLRMKNDLSPVGCG